MTEARLAVSHRREFLADSLTPLGIYRRLQSFSEHHFLLESVAGGEQVSRFGFLGAEPSRVCRVYPGRVEIEAGGSRQVIEGPPLETLRRLLAEVRAEADSIPFSGGWVGNFGYDAIRLVEHLPDRPPDPFGLPFVTLARFDNVIVFDHARQRVVAIANEIEGETDERAAQENLDRLAGLLTAGAEGGAVAVPAGSIPAAVTAPPSLGAEEYQAAVRKAKEYIVAGDIFQVVPARRWSTRLDVEPLALYRALRMVNPSPYMVLLETPDVALISASPEMVVRKTGDLLETRPIAGTRPRGSTSEEDRVLAAELLADPKERAEHLMLVDLSRNDLGRVAQAASVRVADFMILEYYSHVIHLVSSVEARIRPDATALDALLACFPAGTLSGAPKIRAMEIIDELEPEARGPYGGAIGYISFTGDMDTCIAIRTMVVKDGEISVTAGAGIVADSDPAGETRETESKAAAMLQAVSLARTLDEFASLEAAPSLELDSPPSLEEVP